ncbi:MAG: tetratricopeptide repeat protein [Alistipes sp.]
MNNAQLIKIIFRSLLLVAVMVCVPSQAQTDSVAMSAPAAPAAAAASPAAQSTAAMWDAANTAYINADYHTAIEVYERILAQGLASSKLYYNIGNAYFKEGNLSKAILFYNRAQRLTPGNEDVNYNLEVAKSRTKDNIEQIPEFFATTWLRTLRHTMGCTSWSILSLALLVLLLGLLLLYLLAQRMALRKVGFYGTALTLALCIVATWFAVLERQEVLRDDEAIVMVDSSAVKSSPDNAATDLFLLHEGTKVEVSDRLDAWCEVTLADGKKGWIESRKIEII